MTAAADEAEEPVDSDREIAEQYRRERQKSEAEKLGIPALDAKKPAEWLEANPELLMQAALAGGASQEELSDFIKIYKESMHEAPAGSEYDDPHAINILNRVMNEVEKIAVRLGLPVKQVAFGVTPSFAPIASQMPVMLTDASIIGLSIPFFVFCAAVTKAMALTLVHLEVGDRIAVDNRPAAVQQKLKSSPELVQFWFRIFREFGAGTWPADLQQPAVGPKGESITRALLLRAVELFVVAHEYAHHALGHGRVDSTDQTAEDPITQEHDADVVAQTICFMAQRDEIAQNAYAKSGAGAVLILGSLDLVRRATAVLETGEDACEPRRRHPPYRERIDRIGGVDKFAPEAERGSLAERRWCFCELLEIIWMEVRPLLSVVHKEGVRPLDRKTDAGEWLPLSLSLTE